MADGKGKGKGKGKNTFKNVMKRKWQVMLAGKWSDYGQEEDGILKRAFLVGQPNAKFHLRGQDYQYDFKTNKQVNVTSSKERQIRPPPGMTPPPDPLLPPGPMVVVDVPPGVASVDIPDPNNPGQTITVAVPPGAPAGSKMAVPVPEKGESVAEVVKRQRGWSTGAKVAAGAAAVGALAVGGVVLGEHLSHGAVSAWAESTPGVDAVVDWTKDAAHDVGDWAHGVAADPGAWARGAEADTAHWVDGAADHTKDWVDTAATDVKDWAPGAEHHVEDWAHTAGVDVTDAADHAAAWVGTAGEDIGHFVMDLF